MEKLNKLIQPSHHIDFEKILYAWWYACVTNSYYWVRKKSNNPNELEDWLAVKLLVLFNWDITMMWNINPDILTQYKTSPVIEACKECDWKWEVEREYNGYYMDADCPVCNWFNSCWFDPLDTVYVKIWEKYYSARQLDYVLQVFWEIEYWTCWDYLYLKQWEYDCIINTSNVDGKVTNIKVINL